MISATLIISGALRAQSRGPVRLLVEMEVWRAEGRRLKLNGPIKSRTEIDKRKPRAFSSDCYQPCLVADAGLGYGQRSKALLCAVTFLSTGLSCKTLEWKLLALGAAWDRKAELL